MFFAQMTSVNLDFKKQQTITTYKRLAEHSVKMTYYTLVYIYSKHLYINIYGKRGVLKQ